MSTTTSTDRIKVYLRIRPLNSKEKVNDARCLEILNEYALIFAPAHLSNGATKYRQKNARYQFDRIFGFSDDNETVFTETTESLVQNCLEGYDSTVFAYGSTGSGKTHTMMGNPEHPGIIPRAVHALFEKLAEHEDVKLMVSYLEIYNEEVFDLLTESRKRVYVMESSSGITVKGLSQHEIKNPDDYIQLLELGGINRSQCATDSNAQSSRSHAIFQIQITRKSFKEGIVSTLTSHINLVDLAGSERAAVAYRSNRSQALSHEGKKINQSLLSLSNCLSKLASKDKYIPFRGSKLTLILRESFLGKGQTIMIAAASPSWNSYEETQNTLQYAEKAMGITVSVRKNDATTYAGYHSASTTKINQLEELVRQLRDENLGLRETIEIMKVEMKGDKQPLVSNTPFKAPPKRLQPVTTIPSSALAELDALFEKKVELFNKRTKLEFEKTKIFFEKSNHIQDRALINLIQNNEQKIDDYDKFSTRAYVLQDEINDLTNKLQEIEQEIEEKYKSFLEKYEDSPEVKLHYKDNIIRFHEKTVKFYEKTNFKFHSEQLEKRSRETKTLHEMFIVCQKLYCVAAASNLLTDDLNGSYESLRDRIVHGKKEVLFRDALMTTPVADRFNQLRSTYYMPFSTTPLSSTYNKLTLVRSVTPVSRHLQQKLYTANQATEIKTQPKYVSKKNVHTVQMVPLEKDSAINGNGTRKRTLRIPAPTISSAKKIKLQTNELARRAFAKNPRWK